MEEIVRVKEISPLGGAKFVLLENGDSFPVRADRAEKLGVTQGTKLRVVKSPPDIIYYVGDEILGNYLYR